jgi:hypothetical protein
MSKLTKTGRLRDKALADVLHAKQATFDSLPTNHPSEHLPDRLVNIGQKKQIAITGLVYTVHEKELSLKISFRLSPSKTCFSKVWFVLYFEEKKLSSTCINIPQGPLSGNEFELSPVMDMKGISAGAYAVKVEIYEQWSTGEILTITSKEIQIPYVQVSRQKRFIKLPTVKSFAGTDLLVALDNEKGIYRNIEQGLKKEQVSKRDQW